MCANLMKFVYLKHSYSDLVVWTLVMSTDLTFINMNKPMLLILAYTCVLNVHFAVLANTNNGELKEATRSSDECQVTPVIHVLQYPGCVPKPIPSFACIGRCSSYLQVRKKRKCVQYVEINMKTNHCFRKNFYFYLNSWIEAKID